MKLSPSPPRASATTNDTLGHGMDAALTLLLFFGIGFGLDRWLGTTPWFMIGLSVFAGIGFFAKFKYQYDAQMDRLEAERHAGRDGGIDGRPAR